MSPPLSALAAGSLSRALAGETATSSRRHPAVCGSVNESIPRTSAGPSRRSPPAPANPRSARVGKLCSSPVIPAHPRSARKRHDRPVTPEVAGSSPVALVLIKCLQIGTFCCLPWRARRSAPHICDTERPSIARGIRSQPLEAAHSRSERVEVRPAEGRRSRSDPGCVPEGPTSARAPCELSRRWWNGRAD
jgi:hypothetical protein